MTRIPQFALAVSVLLTSHVLADELASTGRQLLSQHSNSVLTVECQLRQSVTAGAQEQTSESKTTVCGTVLNGAGLLAVSLTAVDPSTYLKATNPQARALNIQVEVVSVKIVLPEGAEVPAEIVYRDKDLDLAFVRAKEALPKTVTPVLFQKGLKPMVLDDVFVIWRYGPLASRTLGIDTGRIMGLVSKPRPYYLADVTQMPGAASCPVFSAAGKPLGLILFRFDSGGATAGAMTVVIPADDILEDIQQIAEASPKPPEPAPAVTPAPEQKKP